MPPDITRVILRLREVSVLLLSPALLSGDAKAEKAHESENK
jgi:hypothetical protein